MESKSKYLEELIRIIRRQKKLPIEKSYTSRLFDKGKIKIANKFGEEAIETISAFLSETDKEIISESADLIYHLFVLLEYSDISPDEVWLELKKRMKKN